MLKFFRKIRQKLLDNGNFRKYSTYAIGEILLIVIGILIALQINNWNLKRIDKKVEIEILEGIVENIRMDSIDINYNIQSYNWTINRDSLLYAHLTAQKTYNDTIAAIISTAVYNDLIIILHQSSFEEAKKRGLSIIRNKELRKRLSRFYEFDYEGLLLSENTSDYFNHRDILSTALNNYLEPNPNTHSKIEVFISKEKYAQLLKDKNAHQKIRETIKLRKQILNELYLPIQAKSQKLIEEINQELRILKK